MKNHGSPSQASIDEIKQKFPDRTIALVSATGKGDSGLDAYEFIMTGPTRAEYLKFQQEMTAAREMKGNELERAQAVAKACETVALALTHWPDRPTVQSLFDVHPSMGLQFAETVHGLAGDSFEVRAKKL